MATTRRKTDLASRVLAYSVAGDPRARGCESFQAALSLASTLASDHEKDGEEYRHGVLLNGDLVGSAIRHADGSITVVDYRAWGGEPR